MVRALEDTMDYLAAQAISQGWTVHRPGANREGFVASRPRHNVEIHVAPGGWNGRELSARKVTVETATNVSDEVVAWLETS
ncbi:hypothetical protein [Mycolicibacterium sp.]|uniref:hypothetical protein n=1 Tax=Mycolicibacterium sp. TaxID=2320850 RepID=UPI0037C52FE7